jgi:hypothetical protein
LNGLAQCHRIQGELELAETLYQRAMTLAAQAGNNETIAITLLNLAMLWIDRRSAERARSMLLEVLAVSRSTGSRAALQSVLEVSAGLAMLTEDPERAARFYGAAEAMATDTGIRRDPADASFLMPRVDDARRRLGVEAFEACEKQGRALPAEVALQEARAWLEEATRCLPTDQPCT